VKILLLVKFHRLFSIEERVMPQPLNFILIVK
jgi:hypothetical protein